MRAAAPAALTSGRLSLSLLVASLGFLLVAQGQEANPDALIPTCPPSAVTIPKEYQGAGDPAAGSPFADNLIETLTERSWSSYLMGAVVLTRCLVNYYKAENDPSHMIFDFGSKTDTIYSCARASLNLERKQLQYNTSDFSRGCPTTINKSQPPALSFGSIMGREGCPQLPLDTVPPIPDLYRMPYREYGPGELDAANPGGTAAVGVSPAPANGVGGLGQASAFPQGAAFVIDGYRFILRMAPHFIVHFCTREATLFPLPEGSDPSFAHKLVAGREGFNVACVILARRGFDLIFTQPKVTTSLNSVTCPENMLINTTVPDFFRPTPTPSTTPSSTPTNTATSSETATMTSSSSQTGSPGVSKSSAPSDSAPGIIVRVPLVFPAMSLAHLSSAPANSPIYKAGDALINAAAFFQGGAAGAAGMPSEETAKAFEALKTDISKATGLPESSVRVDWMGIRRVSLFDPLYSKDPIESPSSSSAGGGRLLRDGFSGSSGGGGAGPSFVPPPPHPDPNAANAVLVERFGRSSSSSVSQSRSLAGDEADYGLLIPVELTFTSNPDESWSQDALNALKAKALSVVGKLRDALAAALAATASSPLSGLQRALETLAALSGLSLPLLALPASASAAASSILAAYLPANPSSVEIAATPFPSQAGKIAGIAVGALLILGIVFGGLGFVYRRQIGDALGTSQRSKLRKHLKGLHARSVELQMKRKSFVNVDPESLKKKQGDKKLKNPLAPVAAAALAKLQKEREAQGFVAPQKSSPNGGKAMTENPLAAGDLQDTKAGPLPPRTSISGGSKDVNGQGKDGNSPGEDGEKGGHKRSSLNASKKTISDSAPQFVNPLAAKAAATAAAATASATVENPLGSPSSKQLLASFDESTASGFGGLDNESSSPQHGMLSSALDLRKRWLGGKDDDDIVRNGGSGSHSSKAAAFGSNSSTASRDNVRLAFGPTAAKKGAMVRPGGLRTPSAGSAGGAGRPVSLRVSSKQSMTPQLSASIATSPYTPSLSSSFDENKGNNNDDDYDSPLSSPARNKQKKTAEDDWGSDDDDEEKAGAGTAHNSKKKAENSDSENNDDDDPSHLQGSARNVVAAAAAAKPSSFGSDFGAAIGQATATAARQAVVEEQDPSHGVREWADDDENGGGDDDDDGWGTATSKKRGKKKDTRPSVYDVAAAAFQMLPTARKSVYLGASAAAAAAPQPPIPVPRSPAQSADREARASRVARASQAFFVPPSASELAALQETADKDEAWGGGDDDDNEGRLPPAPLPAPPQPPAAFARAGRVSRVAGPPPPSSSAATFSPPSPVASAAPPAPAPAPVVTTAAAAAPKAKARLVFNDDDDSFGMAPPSKIGRNRGFDDDAW